jgi:hypothetical protein
MWRSENDKQPPSGAATCRKLFGYAAELADTTELCQIVHAWFCYAVRRYQVLGCGKQRAINASMFLCCAGLLVVLLRQSTRHHCCCCCCCRDPRVCPGCLGFAVGDAPDLSNISYAITSLDKGRRCTIHICTPCLM